MSNKNKNSRIILGEASESDSDSEFKENKSTKKIEPEKKTTEIQPTKITTEEPSIKKDLQVQSEVVRENLDLLKKNVTLRSKICTMTDRLIDGIQKELTTSSKEILKSELTLQETITSLNMLRYNTRQLQNKLSTTISCNYFPHIETVPTFKNEPSI